MSQRAVQSVEAQRDARPGQRAAVPRCRRLRVVLLFREPEQRRGDEQQEEQHDGATHVDYA